jgi:hypothetical protein
MNKKMYMNKQGRRTGRKGARPDRSAGRRGPSARARGGDGDEDGEGSGRHAATGTRTAGSRRHAATGTRTAGSGM